jgi:hypothetical protein
VRRLSDLDRDPAGPETHTGAARPDGEWKPVTGGSRQVTAIRFLNEQVVRAYTTWSLRAIRNVTPGLWSDIRTLRPGDELGLDVDVFSASVASSQGCEAATQQKFPR